MNKVRLFILSTSLILCVWLTASFVTVTDLSEKTTETDELPVMEVTANLSE